MNNSFPQKGLYAITPPFKCDPADYLEKIEASIKAGVDALQIREKKYLKTSAFLNLLKTVKDLCGDYRVQLIINDSVMVAKDLACGVHLGKDDSSIKLARQEMGRNAIIGVSCYNSSLRAVNYAKLGASYVALGSFFESPTKPDAVKCQLSELSKLKGKLNIPVVAIGGITRSNANLILKHGADLIAISSYIYNSSNPYIKIKNLQSIVNKAA